MILLLSALAVAMPLPDAHLPALAAALGCESPTVEQWQPVAELDGVQGWAVARCGGDPTAVVVGTSAAWPVPLTGGGVRVHGFLDLGRRMRGLADVGRAFRLSAGPHGYGRPALLVTTDDRLAIVEAGTSGLRVLVDAGRRAEVAIEPGRIHVVDGDTATDVPL